MVAAVQLERSVAGACIFGIVISKLGHRQEPGPIILFEIDKGLKVSLHGAVLPLRLAVGLGVENGGKPLFDAKKVAE